MEAGRGQAACGRAAVKSLAKAKLSA